MITKFTEICAICGRTAECTHHLIPGSGKRALSTKYDLTLPLCNRCHNMGRITEQIHGTSMSMTLSKMLGQMAYEQEYLAEKLARDLGYDGDTAREISEDAKKEARMSFMSTFGESYL